MISVARHIEELTPYKPGQSIEEIQKQFGISDIIKLASNENPLGPSPKALDRIREALPGLNYYPNGGRSLSEALAAKFSLKPENVMCAAGSESVLQITLRTYMQPGDEALTCRGTFVGYNTSAKAGGYSTNYIPLTGDYRFGVETLAANIKANTKLIYIANANNPTGTYITKSEFEWLMERVPENILVIMDEAYFEYSSPLAGDYPDALDYDYPNVISMRTFSKIYGIAGTRVGYAMGPQDIIAPMMKVKLPFEPNALAQAAGLGALEDEEFLHRTVELNRRGLELFHKAFEEENLCFPKSIANFVMIDCGTPETANAFYMNLLRRGIITRPLPGFDLPHCVRISTGTDEQNERLVNTVREVVREMPELQQVAC